MSLRDHCLAGTRVALVYRYVYGEQSGWPSLHESICSVDPAIPETLDAVVTRLLPSAEPRAEEPARHRCEYRYCPRSHAAIVILDVRPARLVSVS